LFADDELLVASNFVIESSQKQA